MTSPTNSTDTASSVTELDRFHRRLRQRLATEQNSLDSFWDPRKGKGRFVANITSFAEPQISAASTSFWLFHLFENPEVFIKFFKDDNNRDATRDKTNDITREAAFSDLAKNLMDSNWKSQGLNQFNIYTSSLMIVALDLLGANFNHARLLAGLDIILLNLESSPSGAARYWNYGASAFLTYWCFQAITASKRHVGDITWSPRGKKAFFSCDLARAKKQNFSRDYADLAVLQDSFANDLQFRKWETRCTNALENIAIWSESELYRQLALYTASDHSFDVIQLAHTLVIYVESRISDHFDDDDFAINNRVVNNTIDIIFQFQRSDGLWPPGAPIMHYPESGPVQTFSFEMLATLLTLGFHFPEQHLFRKHIPALEKCLEWAEQNYDIHLFGERYVLKQANTEFFNGEHSTQQHTVGGELKSKHTLHGWRADHLMNPEAQRRGPWSRSTAAVYYALRKIMKEVEHYLNDEILTNFNATTFPSPTNVDEVFKDFYDSDVPQPKKSDPLTLRETITSLIIQPHLERISATLVNRTNRKENIWELYTNESQIKHASESNPPSYSAIFFGPPGTSKTTLTGYMAESLGWPLVTLQPIHFLADGIDQMYAKIEEIFRHLRFLKDAVIIFDEAEEFVRQRADPRTELPSRLITSSMLTLIQELRISKNAIFILATNDFEVIDTAIKRPGRFDMTLFVGPPSQSEKARMLVEAFKTQIGSGNVTEV